MVILDRQGSRNIRLGNFYTEENKPFQSGSPCESEYLTAEVLSGDVWSDMPGTYTSCPLVVSDKMKAALDEFEGTQYLSFVKTKVKPDRVFWAISNVVGICDEVLVESSDTSGFKVLPDFDWGSRDLIIDISMSILTTKELFDRLVELDLQGFRGHEV